MSSLLLPAILGGVIVAGLIAALIDDGWWDCFGWLAMALPLALAAWKSRRPKRDTETGNEHI